MTKKPVVLVIMDGVGKGDGGPGDAVKLANTPNLDRLFATCPHNWLKAHGTAVGLPTDDDMGNSEVGHNAARSTRRVPSSSASPSRRARCSSPRRGRASSRTATKTARPSISSACCPTATSTRTSIISSPCCAMRMPRASSAPTATSCSTAATCLPRPRSSMSRSSRTCSAS